MKKVDSYMGIKIDTAIRRPLWYLSSYFKYYMVTEYQKSGGSWIAQILSDYLGQPFYRNAIPELKPGILHGHRLYRRSYKNNVIVVFRDGRDCMVSAYFHKLFKNEKNFDWIVERYRDKLKFQDYDDIEYNMPRFIKFMFEEESKGLIHFTWSDFVNSWYNKDISKVKYEEMLVNPYNTMINALQKLLNNKKLDENKLKKVIEKYSFKNQTGRKQGEENKSSFIRKGISGDWKNYFNDEAKKIFAKYASNELILMGYEKYQDWRDWE